MPASTAPRPVDRHPPSAPDPLGESALRRADWNAPRFIDLFAGIGGIRLGLQQSCPGAACVFSSEWDDDAQTTYAANFGHRPEGDITAIDPASIPDHDILLAGFPCQPFSIIGERKGFGDTRGTLFFAIEQILRVRRPSAFLLENVKQFRTHDHGRTCRTVLDALSRLGYFTHTTILNALDFGVPQRRERTFIVGFRADVPFEFPAPLPAAQRTPLSAILEPGADADPRLLASESIRAKRLARIARQNISPQSPSVWHENKAGDIGAHPFSCALRANASYNYLLIDGRRRPSPRELLRLQGFPDSFTIAVSDAAIRKQTGNSVAVPVLRAITREMLAALRATPLGAHVHVRVQPGAIPLPA